LFSGSSDRLRTAIGGYFYIYSASAGETVQFQMLDEEMDLSLASEGNSSAKSPYIMEISRATDESGEPLTTDIDNDSLIQTSEYPVRFTGNTNTILDDNFWKIYWTGGKFGQTTYQKLFSDSIYTDCWFEVGMPYSQEEIKVLEGGSEIQTDIEVSYDYNFYLKDYQKYVDRVPSERLLPNAYLIGMFQDVKISTAENLDGLLGESGITADEPANVYIPEVKNFVSLEDEYPDVSALTSDLSVLTDLINSDNGQVSGRGTAQIHVPNSNGVTLETLNLHEYLTEKVPLVTLSASTTAYVDNALQNIMFDSPCLGGSNYVEPVFTQMADETHELFPYYVKIRFPSRTANFSMEMADSSEVEVISDYGYPVYFGESIIENEYSAKFLKSLKEAFNEEADGVTVSDQEYVLDQKYLSSSQDATYDTTVTTAATTTLRTIDYFDLWTYSYENYNSQTDNCYFTGERTISREAAMDTTSTYRYFNSKGAIGVLKDTLRALTDGGGGSHEVYNEDIIFAELFNGWRHNYTGKYNETIAYRIEKIGGAGTGDAKTQKPLQNFWIFNSTKAAGRIADESTDLTLFDSQIKYGEDYTYNVYKYVIVVGVRYKLSDLILSRITNSTKSGDYCIEFYDPSTGEQAESPYASETEFVTATDPYVADCMVTMEPAIKIYEVPMFSKTLKVIDHPPNQLNLNPFFFLDDSRIIGYNINYETFDKRAYPEPLTAIDMERRSAYLNANDLLEDEDITLETRSQQRYIEIYRLSEKPTTYADFANNLISTLDLMLEDSIYTLPSIIFYDKINTNQKYYYLFRILNENGEPSHLSEIYEAELINDGGYIYGLFNLLFAEDLEIDNFINPSITFQKLLQIQPNMSQIAFKDTDVNYAATATEQLKSMALSTATDPIWDKTFKIRLTSKKTGKKIDLNVTYKYSHNSN